MNKNRKFTDEDEAARRRLCVLWAKKKEERRGGERLSQERVGLEMGWTQSAVSQYLRGRMALGIGATLKFAKYFRVHPNEIRPDVEFPIINLADVEDDLLEHLNDYATLDDEGRALVAQLIRRLKPPA